MKDIMDDKEGNYIVYEDGLLFVMVEKKPAVPGHIKIYPKKKARFIEDLSDSEINHFFTVTSYVATAIFEGIGAHGTNIIINNGYNDDFFEINVIPRTEGDGLDFQWELKRAAPETLDNVQGKLREHTDFIGINIPAEDIPVKPVEQQTTQEAILEESQDKEDDEENYLIRQLNRLP
jgi:diadenosine tetraphosphate (Ap4A) HIT family hydrolase